MKTRLLNLYMGLWNLLERLGLPVLREIFYIGGAVSVPASLASGGGRFLTSKYTGREPGRPQERQQD